MAANSELGLLTEIKHVVVLMMENRSFDHMLGYLGTDVIDEYCVCDAWHSSIPGDTWPNRLYALAGRSADSVAHQLDFFHALSGSPLLANVPIYEVEVFTRQLADAQWRWYSQDPATLRAADAHYRDVTDLKLDNFSYFDRKTVSLADQAATGLIVGQNSFLDDAATGNLREVSWIDPNFVDLSVLDPNSNDDHPPSAVLAGQQLVLDVYNALVNSPNWNDTLLVITYDEHGGFYDHVVPPAVDDGSILLRFARDPVGALANLGSQRVNASPHLGGVLGDPRTDIADHGDLHPQLAAWRAAARVQRQAQAGAPSPAPDGAGQPPALSGFQQEFTSFALAMRSLGLPAGHP